MADLKSNQEKVYIHMRHLISALAASSRHRKLAVITSCLVFLGACNFNDPKAQTSPEAVGLDASTSSFSRIQSELINASCASCHNPGRSAGGIDLTSYAAISKGRSATGAALLMPGDRKQSLLFTVIEEGIMPPSRPVSPELLNLLGCWIDRGARETSPDACQTAGLSTVGQAEETETGSISPATGSDTVATPELTPPTTTPSTVPDSTTPPTTVPSPVEPNAPDPADPKPETPKPETPTPETPTPGENPPTEPLPVLVSSYPQIVQKIISPSCLRCHNDRRPSGGINLSTFAKMESGVLSDGQRLLVPGNPEQSGLFTVIEAGIMPPSGPLSSELKDLLRCWIAAGASETQGDACTTLTR